MRNEQVGGVDSFELVVKTGTSKILLLMKSPADNTYKMLGQDGSIWSEASNNFLTLRKLSVTRKHPSRKRRGAEDHFINTLRRNCGC